MHRAIDINDAIYAIEHEIDAIDHVPQWFAERLRTAIENVPTVDAVPVRHAKWMGTVCTACGESTSFYYDCEYCPHCGAKMDG